MIDIRFSTYLATALCISVLGIPTMAKDQRQWQTDPFKVNIHFDSGATNVQSLPQIETLTLNGIVKIAHRYRAMIDATMHQEGDYIGEYRIQKIVPKRVFFSDSRGIIFRLEFDSK